MITAEYCRVMARYNRWQNENLYRAADRIGERPREADCGAFFGSIRATLSHLLWGDTIWMSRFDGGEAPSTPLAESPSFVTDWAVLSASRNAMDARIGRWAAGLGEDDMNARLVWHSGALGKLVNKPLGLCITHFFNHQTHHRGQVHAMLTAAGAKPGATDLFAMPDPA